MKNRVFTALVAWSICLMVGVAAKENKYTPFYIQRATLFEELPVCSSDIVFIGDSQTNGCEWHEIFGNPNIKNRGISGDVVAGMADRLLPIIEGKPSKLFILGGINDIARGTAPDSIVASMRKLIVEVQKESPATQIYLQSLLPIDGSYKRFLSIVGKEQQVLETNRLYKALSEELGVTWIDLFSLMVDPETGNLRKDLTNDGLHLLGAGYLVWRDAVLPYLKE